MASASTNWSFSSEVDEDRRGNAREWYERDGDAAGPGPGALTLKRPARTIMAHGWMGMVSPTRDSVFFFFIVLKS